MELEAGAQIHAYDNNRLYSEAADAFLETRGRGRAHWGEILANCLDQPADLTFLPMTYHCLDARRAGGGWEAIALAPSPVVVVSLPRKTPRRPRKPGIRDPVR